MNNNERDGTSSLSSTSRRRFIATAATGLAIASVAASPLKHLQTRPVKIRAIAFDAFPIFDPGPVFSLVNQPSLKREWNWPMPGEQDSLNTRG